VCVYLLAMAWRSDDRKEEGKNGVETLCVRSVRFVNYVTFHFRPLFMRTFRVFLPPAAAAAAARWPQFIRRHRLARPLRDSVLTRYSLFFSNYFRIHQKILARLF
jgi:hypothetical protein